MGDESVCSRHIAMAGHHIVMMGEEYILVDTVASCSKFILAKITFL